MGGMTCPICEARTARTPEPFYPVCQSCVDAIDLNTIEGVVAFTYLEIALTDEDAPRHLLPYLRPFVPFAAKLERACRPTRIEEGE